MSSRIRLAIPALLLALVAMLVLVACGGGSDTRDVPEGAIAVVGDKTVTKQEFDALMEQQKKAAEAKKQDFPAVGTPQYEAVKASVVKGPSRPRTEGFRRPGNPASSPRRPFSAAP